MKKILFGLSLAIGFFFASRVSAAIPSTTVWELRASATASNVNGCGFNSARGGTDYTLQDAAQINNTDLSTSGAGATTITSAGSTFTSNMVGNLVHITAGTNFEAGWYEITTFTDANNVVVDRTPSSGGAGSGGTFYVGGACSLNSTLDDDMFDAAVTGNTIYIKNGSFTLGEAVSVANTRVVVYGYNSTRGDNPTGSTRPVINVGANTFTMSSASTMAFTSWTGTAAAMFSAGNQNLILHNKFINTSTTASREALQAGNTGSKYVANEAVSYRGFAYDNGSGQGNALYYNWFHDSVQGIRNSSDTVIVIIGNIVSSNTTNAINYSVANGQGSSIVGNTLYGSENTTGTGITGSSGTNAQTIYNNIIYGFATGITFTNGTNIFENYNTLNNNDTNIGSGVTSIGNSITTAPAFTDVAQVTGTTGAFTAGNDRIVDTSKNFSTSNVVAGRDYIYITGGTGATTGIYGISSITTTTNPNDTLVLDLAPGTNTTTDKTYQITTGQNFAVGTGLKATGYPGAFPGAYTTGYLDIGAVQRQEAGGSCDAAVISAGGVQCSAP